MPQDVPEPFFLSVPDAARYCGVTRNTVYTWVRKGRLSAYQTPGRTNLIRPIDLVHFMQSNGMYVPDTLYDLSQQDDKEGGKAGHSHPVRSQAAVLVVDDDPGVRSLAVRTLQDSYMVFQAHTGYEGLHLLTMYPQIKLVLLDLDLPGQPGLQTLAEIQRVFKKCRVILLSENAGSLSSDLLSEPEVIELLEKPLQSPLLLEQVRAALEG